MTQDLDEKLGALLRGDVIPERDPMFRIRMLERREQQRFRQRVWTLRVALVVLAVLPIVGFALGTRLLPVGLIAIAGMAVVAAGLFSVRGVLLVVRRLRG